MRDTTIVWRPKTYPANKFDFDKVSARMAKLKENNDKSGIEIMTANIERAVEDNPSMERFLTLI